MAQLLITSEQPDLLYPTDVDVPHVDLVVRTLYVHSMNHAHRESVHTALYMVHVSRIEIEKHEVRHDDSDATSTSVLDV